MSSIELGASDTFIVGGHTPGTFVVLEPKDLGWVVEDDPEIEALDLDKLSAQECEENEPGFFHNKLEQHLDVVRRRNEPTLVLSNGKYRYDEQGVPISGAKIACSKCSLSEVFSSFAVMEANIPEECGAPKPLPVCPLYSGQMKRQHDRRNK